MTKPELIADMVAQARNRTPLPVVVKIRVCPDDRDTVELARRVEHAGAAWLTVHGRACGWLFLCAWSRRNADFGGWPCG